MKGAQKELGKFDAKLDSTKTRAFRAGQQIGTGIKSGLKIAAVGVGLIASQVALGLNSLVKLEKAQSQTEAVIKSTGGAAKVTAKDVRGLAEKYEALNALVGDEVIQGGENLLLTFTKIRKDAFEPTLATILDMNTALGKGPDGLTNTVKVVGKALNDPTKGLTALGRVGVTFSAAQIKRIKALQKEGKLYEAQGIILKELDKRFGGSFLAEGATTGGKVAKFTDSIEDLQRALATALLPTVGRVADKLSAFLADPKVVTGISDLGAQIAGLFSEDNINEGAKILGELFAIAKDAAPAIQKAAEVTGKVVSAAVEMFRSLPPELQGLLVAGLAVNKLTGGLVTNIAGGLIGAVLKQLVSANVNIAATNVNVVGGGIGGALGGAAPAAGGGLAAAAGSLVVPVAIAAVTVAAAGALANAIDPSATAPGQETLFNRDPRRFNKDGQVVRNSIARTTGAVKEGNRHLGHLLSQGRGTTARLRAVEAAEKNGLAAVRRTIAAQQLKVNINQITRTTVTVNGRKLVAATERYVSIGRGTTTGVI